MKNCKTCKWWVGNESDDWGECELVGRNGSGNPRTTPNKPGYADDWHEPRLARTYGTGRLSDSGLMTKENFGCVQHEAQKKHNKGATFMWNKQETQEIESYLHNSFVKAREQDKEKYLFYGTSEGIYARLDGYAIIPIEEYFELIGEPVPEPFDKLKSSDELGTRWYSGEEKRL